MKKRIVLPLVVLVFQLLAPGFTKAQDKLDSLFLGGDTTAIIDSLLADFDNFLDSLSKRRSMFFVGVGAGTGSFSFDEKNSVYTNNQQKLIISPMIGYFHKSGLGISSTAYGMSNEGKLSFYQLSVSPSFDIIKRSFSTGISYAHYFTKDSLSFYTTPIRDELYAYFSYKKWWVRPTISFSYGWGSTKDYEEQKVRIWSRQLRQLQRYSVVVENVETVRDFSLTASVRKDFDWYDVFGKDDNITFTPVLLANAGTQQFGFNTSYSYTFNPIRVNSLPSNSSASDQTAFQLQSVSAILRTSYMKGKFLLQPQVLFDYYLLPTDSNPFNTVFSVNLSFAF